MLGTTEPYALFMHFFGDFREQYDAHLQVPSRTSRSQRLLVAVNRSSEQKLQN